MLIVHVIANAIVVLVHVIVNDIVIIVHAMVNVLVIKVYVKEGLSTVFEPVCDEAE